MSRAPQYKVYRDGEYVAACKYAEDAAALVGVSGGDIRLGHKKSQTVFSDPTGEVAAESYSAVAAIVFEFEANQRRAYE